MHMRTREQELARTHAKQSGKQERKATETTFTHTHTLIRTRTAQLVKVTFVYVLCVSVCQCTTLRGCVSVWVVTKQMEIKELKSITHSALVVCRVGVIRKRITHVVERFSIFHT